MRKLRLTGPHKVLCIWGPTATAEPTHQHLQLLCRHPHCGVSLTLGLGQHIPARRASFNHGGCAAGSLRRYSTRSQRLARYPKLDTQARSRATRGEWLLPKRPIRAAHSNRGSYTRSAANEATTVGFLDNHTPHFAAYSYGCRRRRGRFPRREGCKVRPIPF